MKLLIVCGAGYVAGKEIMTLELAKGLQIRKHDVHVMASSWNDLDFPTRLTDAALGFQLLPLGFISAMLRWDPLRMTYGQMVRLPELLLKYGKCLRSIRPERVIHTNWHHLLLLWPYLRPSRDIFWLHEVVPNTRRYRAVFRGLAVRLNCFVAVSHAVSESLQRVDIPRHKIRVIHNGLSDPVKDCEDRPISNNAVRLGIVGQVGTWKGHEDLLDAFGKLVSEWPNVQLHIFGKGTAHYEQHLRKQASELGIAAQVKWHGFLKNRTDIFHGIDICVVPSRLEDPLPTVAIEAAAFSLPVVATQRGGLPEIVEDGVTGIIVPPNDPDRLVDAIRKLLDNPTLRFDMGGRARERMLKSFSKERFITEFLALLQTHS